MVRIFLDGKLVCDSCKDELNFRNLELPCNWTFLDVKEAMRKQDEKSLFWIVTEYSSYCSESCEEQ